MLRYLALYEYIVHCGANAFQPIVGVSGFTAPVSNPGTQSQQLLAMLRMRLAKTGAVCAEFGHWAMFSNIHIFSLYI